MSKHLRFREPEGTPGNIRTNLTFLETRFINLYLPLIVWVYLHSNFSDGLGKTIILRKIAFRLLKVIQGH